MATRRQLDIRPFPNATTLYGWNLAGTGAFNGAAFVGGQSLTENGALTAATNHLNLTVYNDFDGVNDYLNNTNTVFNFTGSFSGGIWAYTTNWANGAHELISRWNTTTDRGWIFGKQTDNTLKFDSWNGVLTSRVTYAVGTLSPGWHHCAWARTSATNCKLYVDGVLSATNTDATDGITAAGNLEIGSLAGGSNKWVGRFQDFFVHNDTILTDAQVAQIYAYGANIGTGKVLSSASFKNTTNLNAWSLNAETTWDGSAWVGGNTLTQVSTWDTGSRFNNFKGVIVKTRTDGTNDAATNATVNPGTGDMSGGIWQLLGDFQTAPTANVGMISRWLTNNGWTLHHVADPDFRFLSYSAGALTSAATYNFVANETLLPGWHYFSFVRTNATNCKLYIDGRLKLTNTDATDAIQAAGTFSIGQISTSSRYKQSLTEAWIQYSALTDAEILRTYQGRRRRVA